MHLVIALVVLRVEGDFMITVLGASFLFVCDESFCVLRNGAVAYDDGIIVEVGEYSVLVAKYDVPDMTKFALDPCFVLDSGGACFYQDSILLPAFVNAHIHFEFSANTTSFDYGSFEAWLSSVMTRRDSVLAQNAIESAIAEQLDSGVGSVGAISSYGGDMRTLAKSPLKVVYFNEVIGANPNTMKATLLAFKERFLRSKELASERFFPAIALHSPYSVHYALAQAVLEFAQSFAYQKGVNGTNLCENTCFVSTHFLESDAERAWLETKSGWFYEFYKHTLGIVNPKPFYDIAGFMKLFKNVRGVFVHCTHLNKTESTYLLDSKHSIVTCPRSNRLLGGTMLDIASLDSRIVQNLGIGSDGASSNINTNMLDELRTALFGMRGELCTLAKILLLAATCGGAKALGLNNGELKAGKAADMALFTIPNIAHSTQPEIHLITLAKQVRQLFINGQRVLNRTNM